MPVNMKALLTAAYELGRDRVLHDPTNFEVLTATSEIADVDWIKVDDLGYGAKAEIIAAYDRGDSEAGMT